MAIAGLRSVSVLDPSFLRDSHSQSSRRGGDGRRGSTRSSSLLQMWREIEDEHVVSPVQGRAGEVLLEQRSDGLTADLSQEDTVDSQELGQGHVLEDAVLGENESETWSQSQSQNESHDGHEDLNNSSCENSSDLGEVERERVRQIFREWMNSGARDHGSNISRRNNSSRREWLGETEQERVRIIREWVQMSSQQRSVSSGENREELSAEIDIQIERVRDGLVINQNEGQTEHMRRSIRKLCGRQVMLDMLKKAERERQREIQELLDHQAVSHFPHRNRIQALLRGRFLRNDRSVDHNRSTSVAESELGLLRRRQTVSGLREGFFSKKDNTGCSQATGNLSDTSSNIDVDFNTNEQTGASSSHMVLSVHSGQSEPNNRGSNGLGISDGQNCLQGTTCENFDRQDSAAHAERDQLQCLQIDPEDRQSSFSVGVERMDDTGQNVVVLPVEDSANELTHQSLQIENSENSNNQEFSEVHNEQSELGNIVNGENNSSNHNNHMEVNIVDDVNWIESGAQEGEQTEDIENEVSGWLHSNIEWQNSTDESMDDNQISHTTNEWPENSLANEDGENSRLQEAPEVWQEDGSFQEAVENWLGGPSDHESAPGGRVHGFYFPDDDNVYSVELRELLNRRSVSNLLHSSFRESLDQLIQSYVERQGHTHIEWELQETAPSSASVEQDLEQQSRDQIVGQEGTVNSSLDLPSLPIPPPLPLWDQHPHRDNWTHNDINNQRLGIDWEIINDLRIDMARLQQRMNNMQRMLEACMDMQLELQRSIRQEVSAALNRSAGSSGIHDFESPDDKSKWECVRKGLCCICCESNIDSLLYRCGHLCTCSKCANELLQSRRKCPMCQAPVVEDSNKFYLLDVSSFDLQLLFLLEDRDPILLIDCFGSEGDGVLVWLSCTYADLWGNLHILFLGYAGLFIDVSSDDGQRDR
ncbi:Zinc finger, RING-type [Sesbania bispinosa]|nr:Zinc finger, RING-type [Sesbania bispinosa]